MKFSVTFEIITEESAECGETESIGFTIKDAPLRECLKHFSRGDGGLETDSYPANIEYPPRWIISYKYDENHITGAAENRFLHFPNNITPSSAIRLARYLGINC